MDALSQYPDNEADFEAQGGECPFCGRTEYGDHADWCPVSEADFAEDE